MVDCELLLLHCGHETVHEFEHLFGFPSLDLLELIGGLYKLLLHPEDYLGHHNLLLIELLGQGRPQMRELSRLLNRCLDVYFGLVLLLVVHVVNEVLDYEVAPVDIELGLQLVGYRSAMQRALL